MVFLTSLYHESQRDLDTDAVERIQNTRRKAGKPRLLKKLTQKAGGGNRTRVISLEGWSFTTKLHPRSHRLNVANQSSIIGRSSYTSQVKW